jgi:hypothetical protein
MTQIVTLRNRTKPNSVGLFSTITCAALLLLIFLSLFVPISYVAFKASLMVIIFFGIMGKICLSKAFMSLNTCYAVVAFCLFGLLNSIHGELNEAPGAIRVLTVMVLWPLFYLFCAIQLNAQNAVRWLISVYNVALISITIYSLIFLGHEFKVVPDNLYFQLDMGNEIGIYDGYTEYNLLNISSLIFLVPLFAHRLICKLTVDRTASLKSLTIEICLIILALILCLLSGRRALQLAVILIPVLVIFSEFILSQRSSTLLKRIFSRQISLFILIIVTSVLALILVFRVDIDQYVFLERMLSGFDFTSGSDVGASLRYEQYESLMRAWWNGNILFGAGNGSCTEMLRDTGDMPWSYELTYIYILYSTGIVGVVFYTTWFGWGLLRLRHALALRKDLLKYITPIVTGIFAFLIATATNPYLGKFDYLWIVFLPHLLAGSLQYQRQEIIGTIAVTS